MAGEFQALNDLGWHRPVFVVDDNIIGNKRDAKRMLRYLRGWPGGAGLSV